MRRRTALVACTAALAAGAAGAVAVPLIWGAPAARVDHLAPLGAGAVTRLATETPSGSPRSSARSMSPASRTSKPPRPRAGPVSIMIRSVGIDAAVSPVGVDPAGDVAIPVRVGTVGWYRFGALPGAAQGSVVLVGHVDSAQQGVGAFFRLHEIGKGATVRIRMASGTLLHYRVVAREEFRKSAVPLQALFSLSGVPRLTLVTCGGSFDARRRSYRDNVVVTAVPL